VIRINVGGRDYDSWDDLPEDVRAQLTAVGIDPGPDGRLDRADLARAGGAVTRRTVVTGPGGAALPPLVSGLLASLADVLVSRRQPPPARDHLPAQEDGTLHPGQPPMQAGRPDAVVAPGDDESTEDHESPEDDEPTAAAGPGRVPLVLGWLVIAATVLLVATVVVIGLSGG
jgi:hypothetical protein